jgi:hypothetical protein
MKYAVEMGSCHMIYLYLPSLIKADSGIQKLIGGWWIHIHTKRIEAA